MRDYLSVEFLKNTSFSCVGKTKLIFFFKITLIQHFIKISLTTLNILEFTGIQIL